MPQMVGNLSIRSKLIGLLAVPVAGSVLLGVAGVAGGFGERAQAAEEARIALVAGQAVAAAHELQEERVRAVAWVATGGRAAEAELAARRRRVDRALAAYRAGAAGLGRTGDPALDQALAAATARLERLPVVRAETDGRLLSAELAGGGHDALVDALLGVARAWTPPARPGPPASCSPWPPPRRPPGRSAPSWPRSRWRRSRAVPEPGRGRARRRPARCCGSGWWRRRRSPGAS